MRLSAPPPGSVMRVRGDDLAAAARPWLLMRPDLCHLTRTIDEMLGEIAVGDDIPVTVTQQQKRLCDPGVPGRYDSSSCHPRTRVMVHLTGCIGAFLDRHATGAVLVGVPCGKLNAR